MYEEIILQIYGLIEEGILKPGDKLPSERDLADQFSVNRATLRQALHTLALLRVLEIHPGDGVYVRQDQSASSLEMLLAKKLYGGEVTSDTLRDIMEIRIILEIPLAGKAARHRTEQEIKHLEKRLEEMKKALSNEDFEDFAQCDFRFHEQIAKMSGNKIVIHLVNYLHFFFADALRNVAPTPERAKKSLAQHAAIYRAIRRQEEKGAKRAMEAHLLDVMTEEPWS